ncbi:MAG: lipid A biosynthesis lauroyl acyltransferase [Acidimicrobiales bacterium]|nr:MAG: lipid A biosynthesis lauroyl acyltransferase [Acidimicrobiales bacterium]
MADWNPGVGAYRAAMRLAGILPRTGAMCLADLAAELAMRRSRSRRVVVERNLLRIWGARPPDRVIRSAVRRTFRSYARYWYESLLLPSLPLEEVDRRFGFEGLEHILRAREEGRGPLMVIPHLGGWEWAARWLTGVAGIPLTAVVEPLEPRELFEFFVEYRRRLGVHVVPLGPSAAAEIVRAVRRREVVCLLADRDIAGNGVPVEFFGEVTTLPAGPATLALRTGAPLLPTAVYFRGEGLYTVVRPPLRVERRGRLRDDVLRVTKMVAAALEDLIRRAPEQWHVMSPNWPSDRALVERLGGVDRVGVTRAADTGFSGGSGEDAEAVQAP